MIKIDRKWIKKWKPCQDAVDWWDKKESNPVKILSLLIEQKRYDWANWAIVRVMSYKQYVSYSVYAAEQVIDIYEKKYPEDKRPREAIEAAKKCIKNPTIRNKHVIKHAAAEAYATAAGVAGAAEAYAAGAAACAAEAADAAGAADAACAAEAACIATAYVSDIVMRLKILQYGMKLLKGG